jgi:hypothetical protein
MEMGSMPGGSFPPPGVLCSVKSDHDLCSESFEFSIAETGSERQFPLNLVCSCEQVLRHLEGVRHDR